MFSQVFAKPSFVFVLNVVKFLKKNSNCHKNVIVFRNVDLIFFVGRIAASVVVVVVVSPRGSGWALLSPGQGT